MLRTILLTICIWNGFAFSQTEHEGLEFLQGEGFISQDTRGNIVILVDRFEEGNYADGSVDSLFVLQTNQHFDDLSFYSKDIKIYHGKISLSLFLRDLGIGLEIFLIGHEGSRLKTQATEKIILSGYGLAYYPLVSQKPDMSTSIDDILGLNKIGSVLAYKNCGGCTEGGVGQASCSIKNCPQTPNECRIGCSSSYHACCSCYHDTRPEIMPACCTCVAD